MTRVRSHREDGAAGGGGGNRVAMAAGVRSDREVAAVMSDAEVDGEYKALRERVRAEMREQIGRAHV